jgi:hypothetical protein
MAIESRKWFVVHPFFLVLIHEREEDDISQTDPRYEAIGNRSEKLKEKQTGEKKCLCQNPSG